MPAHTTHNTPALRFPGYTGVWEQQKAKKLFIDYSDKGHPELPVLSATQDQGMIIREETDRFIQHDKHNEVTYKKVCPGQFVIHLRSFQGGFAHSALTGITSPAYTVFGFQHRDEHDDYFWKYIFSSESFIHRLVAITYGIRDGRSISYSDFLTLDFRYPSAQEQKQIGSFFHHLDGLIHLHQRQTQKLTELKQGLLQAMFPREGESVPRLRFPGFTTTWKQQQFNDVYTSFPNKMYQVQTSEYHEEGKFIVIDQGTNDIAGYTNREDKVCHQFPCIIFGDHTTNIKYVNEPFVVGADGVKTLKATGDCAFASYNLKVNNVTQQGYKRHFSQLKEINVLCPSLSEQRKIGAFFHKLDDLIHLHEQYTVKLTHLKKGLLQKMFPQD